MWLPGTTLVYEDKEEKMGVGEKPNKAWVNIKHLWVEKKTI